MTHLRRFGSSVVLVATAGAAWACGSADPAPASAPSCDGVELIVAASDYSSSVVCGAPGCELGELTTGADLGRDPQLASSNGRTFLLNRFDDLVFELDPRCGTPIARYSVHEQGGSNPHDLAVAPDGSLFVALYSVPHIVVMKGGKPDGPPIDLSGYDDQDRNPQAEAIRIVPVAGVAKAFVALQRLDDDDRLRSKRPSRMLRIDVATRVVEAEIELAGRNPFNTMAESGGAFFLAEPGNFDSDADALAGIERFESATSTTRLLVAERDLGGSVSEVAVTDGCGAAIVAGPKQDVNPTSLVTFDPTTGKVLSTAQAAVLGPTPGYDLQGLAWRGTSLFVGDRRSEGSGFRVHVFDRDPGTCILHEIPARAIDLPQRPVALRPAN
ncbi:MAG: hypothetical protein JWP87_5972 [Labilithrix sp.]|nr:hypothetical protein [Labilithrix sp.]